MSPSPRLSRPRLSRSSHPLSVKTGLLAELGQNINDLFARSGLGAIWPNTDPGLKQVISETQRLLDKFGG